MDSQERAERVRADMGASTLTAMDAVTPEMLEALDRAVEAAERVAQLLHEHGCDRAFVAGVLTAGVFKIAEGLPADG